MTYLPPSNRLLPPSALPPLPNAPSERLALRLSELPAFFRRPGFCLDAALAHSASERTQSPARHKPNRPKFLIV